MQSALSVTLNDVLSRSRPYEQWTAPMDPNLRRGVILACCIILASLLLIWSLPGLMPLAGSEFFWVLGEEFGQILVLLNQARPFLAGLNLVGLAACAVLLVQTDGLRAGRASYHWVAMAEVVLGAANGFIIALELAIIIVNIVIWIVVIVVGIAILVGVLAALASS